MKAFAGMVHSLRSGSAVSSKSRLEARQAYQDQFDGAIDNRRVKELVVFFHRQTVCGCKLFAAGLGEGFPHCGSVDDTVVASGSVRLLDGRGFIQTLKWRWTAEIVRHFLPLNGIHNLFRGAAEEAGKIQWLFVSDGQVSFLDYAGVSPSVARASAAKAKAHMTDIVEAVAKKSKGSGAN